MAVRQPERPIQSPENQGLLKRPNAETGIVSWLTTVDHKRLGILYFVTTFGFFLLGSVEAFLIRLQLAAPNQQLIGPDLYNQIFTMHGLTMIFLAVMPLGTAFANYFVPLMIGARDLAFPRLNAFGYWAYLAGGLILYSSFLLGGAPDAGWFAYAPMTQTEFTPGTGIDFYIMGLLISGIGTLVTAMNLIVTIINMRAPGMTMMRMPLFPWMMLVTAFLVIFAFPPLTIALVQVMMDRTFGTLFFDPTGGGMPILWQHLFWVFGHPRGLHRHPARLRRDQRGHPDLLAQAALRLPNGRLSRDFHRLHGLRGVEPPHVHHRSWRCRGLRLCDYQLRHRRADGY